MLIGWFAAHLDRLMILIVNLRDDLSGSPKRGRSCGLALSNLLASPRCQLIATRIYCCFAAFLNIGNQCTTLLEASGFAEGCQSLRLLSDDSSTSVSSHI